MSTAQETRFASEHRTDPQVAAAKETVTKIAAEESSLNDTLSNIKDARPFEDLTVGHVASFRLPCSCQINDVAKARPEVQKTVDTMLQKGKWSVPGYRVSLVCETGRVADCVGEIRRACSYVDGGMRTGSRITKMHSIGLLAPRACAPLHIVLELDAKADRGGMWSESALVRAPRGNYRSSWSGSFVDRVELESIAPFDAHHYLLMTPRAAKPRICTSSSSATPA